jgi:hypothetical protein
MEFSVNIEHEKKKLLYYKCWFKESGDVAEWYSTCLPCAKAVDSVLSIPQEEKIKINKWKGWRSGLSTRMPAYQAWGPEFKSHNTKKS